MANEITIDDLYTDPETFNQKAVLHMLKNKIVFTQEDEIVFIVDPTNLKARNQILIYALAKKILKANQKIENEAITNTEIKNKTKLNKNTVAGTLKRLKDGNILVKSQSGYEIPPFKVEEALSLLNDKS